MSEQNIASIVDGVEDIYRGNRRHGALHKGNRAAE